ncbi:MAG: hypothetical protein K6F72_08685 [Bacteroidales bacterium]|nr:hypothetical protein [Bacteroidales bacterium]
MKHIALFAALLFASYALAQDHVKVTGTVINGADGNPLPFCYVHLLQDGRSKVYAVTDYAGNFNIPVAQTGSFDFLVVQFGDTLMHYKGLTLSRDTWVRSVVMPPSEEELSNVPYYDAGNYRYLKPVLVVGRHNLLYDMGLLITSPNDPRLGIRSASKNLSTEHPIETTLLLYHPGFEVSSLGSTMKNELILYGRILDVYIPAPTESKEAAVSDTTAKSGN